MSLSDNASASSNNNRIAIWYADKRRICSLPLLHLQLTVAMLPKPEESSIGMLFSVKCVKTGIRIEEVFGSIKSDAGQM